MSVDDMKAVVKKGEETDAERKSRKSRFLWAFLAPGLFLLSVVFFSGIWRIVPDGYASFIGALEPMPELEDLSAVLDGAGALLLPLTENDGKVDLLFVGSPDCSHCQDFVAEHLDEVMDFATENDLDFHYFPTAMASPGYSVDLVMHCARDETSLAPVEFLKTGYRAMDILAEARTRVEDLLRQGASEEEAAEASQAVLVSMHESLGTGAPFDMACFTRESQLLLGQMGEISERLDLVGTPSFYLQTESMVLRKVGTANLEEIYAAFGKR